MKWTWISFFWLISAGARGTTTESLQPIAAQRNAVEVKIKAALERVAQIRGQKSPESAPFDIATREKLVDYVRTTIREKFSPEQLLVDRWSPVALSMMKQPLDSIKVAEGFAGDQVAGFYDPKLKKLFIADWVPTSYLDSVLIHELTHFMQDRQVPLERFVEVSIDKTFTIPFHSTESQQARHALVEGEALFVMALEMEKLRRTPGLLTGSDDISFFLPGYEQEIQKIAQKLEIPTELAEVAFFSYIDGYRFVRALHRKGGFPLIQWAFSCPPERTAQVRYPKHYLTSVFSKKKSKPQCSAKSEPERLSKNFEDTAHQLSQEKKLTAVRSDMGVAGLSLFLKFHLGRPMKERWIEGLVSDAIYFFLSPEAPVMAGFFWSMTFSNSKAAKDAYNVLKPLTQQQASAGSPRYQRGQDVVIYENSQLGKDYLLSLQGKQLMMSWNLPREISAPLHQASIATLERTKIK